MTQASRPTGLAVVALEAGAGAVGSQPREGAAAPDATATTVSARLYLPDVRVSGPAPLGSPKPFPAVRDESATPNNTCTFACILGFDLYSGTIDRASDTDGFESIVLLPGKYRVHMQPPRDVDYDLQVYEPHAPARLGCPGNLYAQSRNGGDEAEWVDLTLSSTADFYFRVYGADASRVDMHNPYVIQIQPLEPTPTLESSTTPTFTARPPATATPTLVVAEP